MDFEKEALTAIREMRSAITNNHNEVVKTINDNKTEANAKHAKLDKEVYLVKYKVTGIISLFMVIGAIIKDKIG